MKKKIIIYPLALMAITSCSSYRSESFESKFRRYNSKKSAQSLIPELKVPASFRPSNRAPASVKKTKNTIHNKGLYFLTLIDQYDQLKTFSKTSPAINHCPSFHGLFLNYKKTKKHLPKRVYSAGLGKDILTEKSKALLPELNLPVAKDSPRPTTFDILKKNDSDLTPHQIMTNAISIHITKTYNEVVQLCQTGQSDNYYAFENLVTASKTRGTISKNINGLKILYKTTLFSNQVIINSLYKNSRSKGRFPASFTKDLTKNLNAAAQRLGVNWAMDSFKYKNYSKR